MGEDNEIDINTNHPEFKTGFGLIQNYYLKKQFHLRKMFTEKLIKYSFPL